MISLGATVEFILMRMDFRDMQHSVAGIVVKELEKLKDANKHLDLKVPPVDPPR